MRQAIINAKVITPLRVIQRGAVVFDGGRIERVYEGDPPDLCKSGPSGAAAPYANVYDARGLYASPGFIDTHVHGGGGYSFMDGAAGDVIGACKAHMEHGTTTILPTSVACPDGELIAMLGACREAMKTMTGGPCVPGVHLEGSYFNIAQAGAQNPEYIVNPDPDWYNKILDEYPEILRWSAAPELPGGLELGRELRRRGVLCSIAHSDAIWEEAREAFLNGYTHATHLYSGMSMTRRISAYRHGGVVEAAYLLDGMTVEIIADGKHLPEELLRLVVKIKGCDKVMLVTDAMSAAGLYPSGTANAGASGQLSGAAVGEGVKRAKLGSKKNSMDAIIEDDVAKTPDRLSFAGSIATADRLVRTMTRIAETPLREAVRMMTLTPAAIMGFKTKGALSEGMDADIVLFDEDVNVKTVFVNGEITHNAK